NGFQTSVCNPHGEVICVGYTITEIPKHLPVHTYTLNLTQKTLAPEMFEGLSALLILDLTRNKLTGPGAGVFDGLTNLTVLNLGRNNIKKFPKNIFHSLTKLRRLRVYNNELESLEEGIFDQLTSLEELILHGNKIEGIAPQVMLNLSKNPWDCNCAIRDFARWIRNNPRIVIDIDDVLCHSPIYHVLRRVNSLRDDEFTYCDEKRIQTSLYEPAKTTHVSITTEEVRRYPTPRMRLHKSLQPLHVIPTTPLSKSTVYRGHHYQGFQSTLQVLYSIAFFVTIQFYKPVKAVD
uniref:LRRCT domain-containing protein n=1 Tax=Oryzias latipes TaxID=8090 RepID=A0A3B3HLM3_ORYLA